MEGWMCPRCGQCYSPFVQKCSSCALPVTTTSNTCSCGTAFPCQMHPYTTYSGFANGTYVFRGNNDSKVVSQRESSKR